MPKYSHDCTDCVYLGEWVDPLDRHVYDLYSCPQPNYTSYLARYGSKGQEYASQAVFKNSDTQFPEKGPLFAAKVRDFLR